jgi:hypothetical protein
MLAMTAQKPELVPVRRAEIRGYWDDVWPLIHPAVARGGLYTQESVLDALIAGDMQLWLGALDDEIVLALVTEIAAYPARTICTALFIGGRDLDRFMRFLPEIEQWARENGCHRFIACGRRGWVRKLQGFEERDTMVVKDYLQ